MEQNQQLVLDRKQTTISKPSVSPSEASIKIRLTALATARQASVSAADLNLYAKRLLCFPLNDVTEVLERISHEPRGDGETAFPPCPDIEKRIRQFQVGQRVKRAELERNRLDAEEFDKILRERLLDGETEEGFCGRFPSLAKNWRAWKRSCEPAKEPARMNAVGQ